MTKMQLLIYTWLYAMWVIMPAVGITIAIIRLAQIRIRRCS